MKKLLLLLLTLALTASIALLWVWQWWQRPGTEGGDSIIVTVRSGASLASVAQQLQRAELLAYPSLWQLIARLQGQASTIKRGEFELSPAMSPQELLATLVAGKVVLYRVTLPEGINLREAIGILHSHPQLSATLDGITDNRLRALVAAELPLEGQFFPDTYTFPRGETDFDVLRAAHRRMREELQSSWEGRRVGLPLASPQEALILASIVEKETGLASERKQIAGVFIRRLQKNMKLQTDPTIIFGLGDNFDGDLRRSHLEDAGNRYNTYQHRGLPPGPIALPGKAAIEAALHPEDGEALYFVARGDGSHVFSTTLEQHNAAVRQYQLKRRKDYRSSPARRNKVAE